MRRLLLLFSLVLFQLLIQVDARLLTEKEANSVEPRMAKVQAQKLIGQPCDSRAVDGGDTRNFYKAIYEGSKAIFVLDINPKGIITAKTLMSLDGVQYMPEYKNKCW
jgi:hypothetical protein